MKFYSRKKPQKKSDILIERVSTGICDDLVVSELKVAASEFTDPSDMESLITGLMDIATRSDDPVTVANAIKSLLTLRPLTAGLEDDLEKRALDLVKDNTVISTRQLQEALAELLYIRVSEKVERAQPFIGALALFLDERTGKGGTMAYNTLMIVAANKPEFFDQQTVPLIKMLGSINNATRIETSKIIAVLATSHPEYVADAEKTLLHISSFNPDGELKNAASEAYQILSGKLQPGEKGLPDDNARRNLYERQQAGGLAGIMRRKADRDKKPNNDNRVDKRLLSLATNFGRKADHAYKVNGESQAEFEENETQAISRIMDDFSEVARSIKAEAAPVDTAEEAELRKMMEKVQDDFSVTAGSILDAIGMGHLANNPMTEDGKPGSAETATPEHSKRAPTVQPDPARAYIMEKSPAGNKVKEEPEISPKEFIASIESMIGSTDNVQTGQRVASIVSSKAEDLPASLDNIPASTEPRKDILAPAATVDKTQFKSHVEIAKPEKQAPAGRPEEQEKRARSPIAPPGVRISTMKFKSADQSKSKKPAPAKILMKPHIKPLSKPPEDAIKNTVPVQQPTVGAPEVITDDTIGYVICHACNAKMPEDSQRCAICGSDLKSPKVRCHMCGEIIPRHSSKCTRCGSTTGE